MVGVCVITTPTLISAFGFLALKTGRGFFVDGKPRFFIDLVQTRKGIIMTKLYPIGTQLITRRLSQAALADELGFCVETQVSTGEFYPTFDIGFDNFDRTYDTWRVTVTKDNQTWLSPLIMVGDYVHFNKLNYGFYIGRIIDNEVFKSDVCQPWGIWYASIEDEPEIISRIYPNGLRAPLIEWDEVILPETKGE
jgi:hypothetical protein